MRLFETLAEILSRLQEQAAQTALLGGLAVSAWAEPRFTRDVDLAVAVHTDAEAERLIQWDAIDLRALRTLVDAKEEQRAREACELIMRRGFQRRRDLRDLLDAYLAGPIVRD
jgi:hypothetical protein